MRNENELNTKMCKIQ